MCALHGGNGLRAVGAADCNWGAPSRYAGCSWPGAGGVAAGPRTARREGGGAHRGRQWSALCTRLQASSESPSPGDASAVGRCARSAGRRCPLHSLMEACSYRRPLAGQAFSSNLIWAGRLQKALLAAGRCRGEGSGGGTHRPRGPRDKGPKMKGGEVSGTGGAWGPGGDAQLGSGKKPLVRARQPGSEGVRGAAGRNRCPPG